MIKKINGSDPVPRLENIQDIDKELAILKEKKRNIECRDSNLGLFLLHYFLQKSIKLKEEVMEKTKRQLSVLTAELYATEGKLLSNLPKAKEPPPNTQDLVSPGFHAMVPEACKITGSPSDSNLQISRKRIHLESEGSNSQSISAKLQDSIPTSLRELQEKHISRLSPHFSDLEAHYLQGSSRQTQDATDFAADLLSCSSYSKFKTIASLHYADNFFNFTSSIVSSIEFDRDDEYFATAGVTKKIKIFDFESIVEHVHSGFISKTSRASRNARLAELNDPEEGGLDSTQDPEENMQDIEFPIPKYPIKEMTCNSKISCLSWNNYMKPYLLSSDYEGIVALWDTSVGACVSQFDEHEKRAWSVDFSTQNPNIMASGGDDSKVKLWSISQRFSTGTIESKANVCSVKFHPSNSNEIVFGSADHHCHIYDLRKLHEPLHIFKGHRKAVSYVKFLKGNQLITASTDCSLRLWSLSPTLISAQKNCIRSYSGHVNEKNFVGLSVNSGGEFISCGSETNQVFAYHQSLSKPIASHRFGNSIDAISGLEVAEEDPASFVSSVCWKRKTPDVLVCANSQGRVKVMQMC